MFDGDKLDHFLVVLMLVAEVGEGSTVVMKPYSATPQRIAPLQASGVGLL